MSINAIVHYIASDPVAKQRPDPNPRDNVVCINDIVSCRHLTRPVTYWLRTLGFRPGGWLEPSNTGSTPRGEPRVIRVWTGHSGWAHSASYAISVPSECATITRVPIKSVGEPLLYDRTDSWIGEVSLDLLNVVQNEALGKSTEKAGPFQGT